MAEGPYTIRVGEDGGKTLLHGERVIATPDLLSFCRGTNLQNKWLVVRDPVSEADMALIIEDARKHPNCELCALLATKTSVNCVSVIGTICHSHGHVSYRKGMIYRLENDDTLAAFCFGVHECPGMSIEDRAKLYEYSGFDPKAFVLHHKHIFCRARLSDLFDLATFVYLRGTMFKKALNKVLKKEEATAAITLTLQRLGLPLEVPRGQKLDRFTLTVGRVLSSYPAASLAVASKYESTLLPAMLPPFLRTTHGYQICTDEADKQLCLMAATITGSKTAGTRPKPEAVRAAQNAAKASMASTFCPAEQKAKLWELYGWSKDPNTLAAQQKAATDLRTMYGTVGLQL